MTGGVAAVVVGGVAVGGGASMITNPISKVFFHIFVVARLQVKIAIQ